jgi:sugar PTS system EIIA component
VTVPVLAPLTGEVVGLVGVPDPVFSDELVGGGTAIEPPDAPGRVEVVSPVAGSLFKLHPHAFVVLAAGTELGVLVHLGIDTVKLHGEGFELLAAEGDTVEAGTPVVAFDPARVRAKGLSAVCPVVVLDSAPGSYAVRTGVHVAVGEPLFEIGA